MHSIAALAVLRRRLASTSLIATLSLPWACAPLDDAAGIGPAAVDADVELRDEPPPPTAVQCPPPLGGRFRPNC